MLVLRRVVLTALNDGQRLSIRSFLNSSVSAAEAVWLRLSVLLAAGMRYKCLDAALSIASLLLLQWSQPGTSRAHECVEVLDWLRAFNNHNAPNQSEVGEVKKSLCATMHRNESEFAHVFRRQGLSGERSNDDVDLLDPAHWGPLSLRTHHATIAELCFATAFASERTVSLQDGHDLITCCSSTQGNCLTNTLQDVFTSVNTCDSKPSSAMGLEGVDKREEGSTRKFFCLSLPHSEVVLLREGGGGAPVVLMSIASPWIVYFSSHSQANEIELLHDDVRGHDDVTCLQVVYGVLPVGVVTSAAVPASAAPMLLSFIAALRCKFREALIHGSSAEVEGVMGDVLLVLRQQNRSVVVVKAGSSRTVTIAGRDSVVVGDTMVERCVSADLVPSC